MSSTEPISGNLPVNLTGLFDTIYNNDISTLKLLMRLYPECYKMVDENGQNLLHIAIMCTDQEIFDYLLSLDKLDLNAETYTGETPLYLSTTNQCTEHFSLELIKRGVSTNHKYYNCNTALHLALKGHQLGAAHLLIEKGADVNAQNDDGCTPFHMLFSVKWNIDEISEGIGMMMFYGADASIPDNNGVVPFELAIKYDPELAPIQESLFLYTFDQFSDYKIPVEIFFDLVQTRSKLFFEIVNIIAGVDLSARIYFDALVLFSFDPRFLVVLVEKFDYVIRKILDGPVISWYEFKEESFTSFEILLNSHLRDDILEFVQRLKIIWVIVSMIKDKILSEFINDFIFYLLTLGIKVTTDDLDIVHKEYGYCDLFKLLLHMDIEISSDECDVLPRMIYDVHYSLETFLYNTEGCYYLYKVAELLEHFAHPELKQICLQMGVNNKTIISKVESLPKIPFLVELARNSARKFLVERYNVKTSKEFYTLLKQLPISSTHEKILSFETKLYG